MYRENDQPIPGYTLVHRLGGGALGDVWRAIAPGGVSVALKIVALRRSSIAREFQGTSRLKSINHPHLVSLSGIWLKDETGRVIPLEPHTDPRPPSDGPAGDTIPLDRAGELIIAMNLCEKSLDDRRAECERAGLPGIPRPELLKYLRQAAEAIDFLNTSHSIQHCDIKPANILLAGGGAQVCDYGLAEQWNDARATQDFMGTPAYAAPELLLRGRASASTDQFSLAITYYELATGTLPYPEAATRVEREQAIRNGRLDFSRSRAPEAAVLRRATSKNPQRRFPSCEQFIAELTRATAPPPSTGSQRRLATFAGRTCLVGAVLLLALVLLDSPWRAASQGARAVSREARRERLSELQAKADSAIREATRLEQEGADAELRLAQWNGVIAHHEELAAMTKSHEERSAADAESLLPDAYRQRALLHFEMGNWALSRLDLEACRLQKQTGRSIPDKARDNAKARDCLLRLPLDFHEEAAEPDALRQWLALYREVTELAPDALEPPFQRAAIDTLTRLIAVSPNPAASDHAERLRLRLALLKAGERATIADCHAAVRDARRAGPPPEPLSSTLDTCRLRWAVFSARWGVLLHRARWPWRECSPNVNWLARVQEDLSSMIVEQALNELEALSSQAADGAIRHAAVYESGLLLLDLGRHEEALERFDAVSPTYLSAAAYYHRAICRWGRAAEALAAAPNREEDVLPEAVRVDLEAVINDLTTALDLELADSERQRAAWPVKAHLLRAWARQELKEGEGEAILTDLKYASSSGNPTAMVEQQLWYLSEYHYAESIAAGRRLLRRPVWGWNGLYFQDDVYNFLALAMKEAEHARRNNQVGAAKVEVEYLLALQQVQQSSTYALQTFYWGDLENVAGGAKNLLEIFELRRTLKSDIDLQLKELEVVAALDGEQVITRDEIERVREITSRGMETEKQIEMILRALAVQSPPANQPDKQLQSLADLLRSHPEPAVRGGLQTVQLRMAGKWQESDAELDRLADAELARWADTDGPGGEPPYPFRDHADVRCLYRGAWWWGHFVREAQRIRFERSVEALTEDPPRLASPWAGQWNTGREPSFRIASSMLAQLPIHAGGYRLMNRLALQLIETSRPPSRLTVWRPWRTTPLDLLIALTVPECPVPE